MEDKTKIVLVAIGILILMLVVFWLMMVMDRGNNVATPVDTGKTEPEPPQETADSGAIPPLIRENGCGGIADAKERLMCQNMEAMGRAVANSDPAYCQQISDAAYRDHCLRVINQSLGDVEGCRTIGAKEWENVCIMEIAHNKADPAVCDEIDYPYTGKKCKTQISADAAKLNNDMAGCLVLPKASNFRNLCIWTLASANGVDACNTIENTDDKNVCLGGYYLGVARSTSDASYCQQIALDAYKKTCIKVVNAVRADKEPYFNSDTDNLDDLLELSLNTDPFSNDTDKDGVDDNVELYDFHTDPLNPDTDGDGRIDGKELKQEKDINVPD